MKTSKEIKSSLVKLLDCSFKTLTLDELKDETIAYGLRNYIAKYSLANDEYFISDKALNLLNLKNLKSIKRCHKKKLNIKFEHMVPSKVIYDYLLDLKSSSNYNKKNLKDILELTSIVTIITKSENDSLDSKKDGHSLRAKMPENKKINEDNLFSRYDSVGIRVVKNEKENDGYHKINVSGAIYR